MFHHMKRKNYEIEGEVALKLDDSKAYDRVDWGYLQDRISQMGFSEKWVNWVMLCKNWGIIRVGGNGSNRGNLNASGGKNFNALATINSGRGDRSISGGTGSRRDRDRDYEHNLSDADNNDASSEDIE